MHLLIKDTLYKAPGNSFGRLCMLYDFDIGRPDNSAVGIFAGVIKSLIVLNTKSRQHRVFQSILLQALQVTFYLPKILVAPGSGRRRYGIKKTAAQRIQLLNTLFR